MSLRSPISLRALVRYIGETIVNLLACCVLLLMTAIFVQVIASRIGITTLVEFSGPIALFGEAITLNSLTDLQWYLMAVIALVPAAFVWVSDDHVRVDFAYQTFSSRGRSSVDLAGHILFALPFLIMCIPASWAMTIQAFSRGEKSANGGLWDRFLVKGAVPFGFTLILIIIVLELWPLFLKLVKGDRP